MREQASSSAKECVLGFDIVETGLKISVTPDEEALEELFNRNENEAHDCDGKLLLVVEHTKEKRRTEGSSPTISGKR